MRSTGLSLSELLQDYGLIKLLLLGLCCIGGRSLRPTVEPRLGPTSFLGAALGAASAASARTTSLAARWGLAANNNTVHDQCHAASRRRKGTGQAAPGTKIIAIFGCTCHAAAASEGRASCQGGHFACCVEARLDSGLALQTCGGFEQDYAGRVMSPSVRRRSVRF
jgi:hypothetical protein